MDVFDYRNGRLVFTVRWAWLARLLTFPGWHGPAWSRSLWARTGMLDYAPSGMGQRIRDSVPEGVCPGCKRPCINGECLKCDGDGNPWDGEAAIASLRKSASE